MKVFQARLGFYDTVVAAPSQAAALRAWGMHQNLFADNQAWITQDAQAVEAALQQPETPLKRPVGSTDPFERDPTSLPNIPDAPKLQAAAPPKPSTAKPAPPPKPAPDRKALSAAEGALKALDDDRKREEAEYRARETAIEAEREQAQTRYVSARKAAAQAVVAARIAYKGAGGEDG